MMKFYFLWIFSFFIFWQLDAQLTYDNTCTTAFIDISSTGTALNLTDDSEDNVTMPFDFTLDGVTSSNLRVGNNGGVLFNTTVGDVFAATQTLQGFYPLVSDIDADYGNVYYETVGTAPNRMFVVLWYDRPHYSNSPSGGTFELILHETTNEVTFLYQDLDFGNAAFDNGVDASVLIIGAYGTYTYSNDTSLAGISCIHWSLPTCYPPNNLNITDLTTSSATLNWTAPTIVPSNGYDYEIRTSGAPGSGATGLFTSGTTTDVTVPITGLTIFTNYNAYVRGNCDGDYSNWIGPVNFYTGHCVPTQSSTALTTYINNFETSNGITNISNLNSGRPGTYSDYYYTQSVSTNIASTFDVTVGIVGPTVGCAIWVDWNQNLLFEASEVAFTTTGYQSGPNIVATITVPSDVTAGDYKMRVMIDYNDANPGDDSPCALTRGEVEDYKISIVQPTTDEMDWINLQFAPTTVETCQSFDIYTQGYEAGLTDTSSTAVTGVSVQIAISTEDTDPSTWASSLWQNASSNPGYDFTSNNDEYMLSSSALPAGTYYIASRWILNFGPFVYGGSNGIWDNDSWVLTVTEPNPTTLTADSMEICMGESVTLTASSEDTTTTFEWDNDLGTGESQTVTPTETTTYTVTGTNGATCTTTASITIVVNETPSVIEITADPNPVCSNSVSTLTAVGGESSSFAFQENFNAATNNWINNNNSTGGTIANAAWTLREDNYVYTRGFTSYTFHSNDNSQFYLSNSDAQGTGSTTDVELISPVFSTENISNTTLTFYLCLNYNASLNEAFNVDVSTDGGTTWTTAQSYTADIGTQTNFLLQTIDLSAYDNMPSVQLRFYYHAVYAWFVAIDNISVSGLSRNIQWSPATNLFTDEEASIPYVDGEFASTVYFSSDTDGSSTYTATAISLAGCTVSSDIEVTVSTSSLDAPTAESTQNFCTTSGATIADLVATGTTLTWYDAPGGNVLTDSTLLVDGTTYYVTDTSASGCESAATSVEVNFDDTLCAPVNDECANAMELTVDNSAVNGTTTGATGTAVTTCDDGMSDGVWYTVTGDGTELTVTVIPDDWDAEISIFEGTCGAFTCVDNSDDNGLGEQEIVSFDSTSGTVYYVLIGSNDGTTSGNFTVEIVTNLGIDDIDNASSSITLYPNPVKDVLYIKTDKVVKVAQIYANDGSLVKDAATVIQNTVLVNDLSTGTYIIKVILDDQSVVTEKFIKQ